jgi:undecaprenyl-diphosphatase
MNGLLGADRALFHLMNGVLTHPWLDRFFPFLTDLDHFRWPLAGVWLVLMIFGGSRGRRAAVFAAVALALSDPAVNAVIKPAVHRTRPCVALEDARVLVDFTRSPSFPSSHAANIFAALGVLAWTYRRWRLPLLVIAALVAYSRIYVGVHYPLDALGGAAIGAGAAAIALWLGPHAEAGLAALIRRLRGSARGIV